MEIHLTTTECHLPHGITQCYLPPDTSEHTPPLLLLMTNLSPWAVLAAGHFADLLKDLRFVCGRNCRDPHAFGGGSTPDRWHWSTRLVAGTCSPKSMTLRQPLDHSASLHHPCVTDDERTPMDADRRLSSDNIKCCMNLSASLYDSPSLTSPSAHAGSLLHRLLAA